MIDGSLDALAANPNGIVIGQGLVDKFSLRAGQHAQRGRRPTAASRPMKVVGIFRTGNAAYDETQTFVLLKRAQSLLDRPNRVNRFIIQLDDPYAARDVAQPIEAAHRLQVGVVGRGVGGHPERAADPQHHHVQRRLGDPGGGLVRHLQHDLDHRDGEDARHRDHEVDGLPRARRAAHLPARGPDRRRCSAACSASLLGHGADEGARPRWRSSRRA